MTPTDQPKREITEFRITDWIEEVINGTTGFKTCEQIEFMSHPNGRCISVAEWVIRCLANPKCKDSDKMLEAINKQRNKHQHPNLTPEQ